VEEDGFLTAGDGCCGVHSLSHRQARPVSIRRAQQPALGLRRWALGTWAARETTLSLGDASTYFWVVGLQRGPFC